MKQRRKQPLARAIDGNIMKKEQPEYLHMFIKIFQSNQNVLSHLVVHYSRKKERASLHPWRMDTKGVLKKKDV